MLIVFSQSKPAVSFTWFFVKVLTMATWNHMLFCKISHTKNQMSTSPWKWEGKQELTSTCEQPVQTGQLVLLETEQDPVFRSLLLCLRSEPFDSFLLSCGHWHWWSLGGIQHGRRLEDALSTNLGVEFCRHLQMSAVYCFNHTMYWLVTAACKDCQLFSSYSANFLIDTFVKIE